MNDLLYIQLPSTLNRVAG